jgi:hypothetical protein
MDKPQAVILDDLKRRHDTFDAIYGGVFNIEHCYNIAQFAHFLLSFPGRIEFISLDHDLGDMSNETLYGNGMDAAKMIIALNIVGLEKVAVHSWNGPKAKDMVSMLLQHGIDASIDRFSEN